MQCPDERSEIALLASEVFWTAYLAHEGTQPDGRVPKSWNKKPWMILDIMSDCWKVSGDLFDEWRWNVIWECSWSVQTRSILAFLLDPPTQRSLVPFTTTLHQESLQVSPTPSSLIFKGFGFFICLFVPETSPALHCPLHFFDTVGSSVHCSSLLCETPNLLSNRRLSV